MANQYYKLFNKIDTFIPEDIGGNMIVGNDKNIYDVNVFRGEVAFVCCFNTSYNLLGIIKLKN